MIYTLQDAPKKIQYLVVDSNFIQRGVSNNFVIDFNNSSNVFIQEMKDVIGLRLVDFYITQVGTNDNGVFDSIKYIDVKCKEIPVAAQVLNERSGIILERIPIERNYSGSTNLVVHDKQWNGSVRKPIFFNPMSIKHLSFELYEQQGDGDYVLLRPSCYFFMLLEVHTLDHKAPPPTPDRRIEKLLEKMSLKLDKLIEVKRVQEVKTKKIPFHYLILGVLSVVAGYFFIQRKKVPLAPPVPLARPLP